MKKLQIFKYGTSRKCNRIEGEYMCVTVRFIFKFGKGETDWIVHFESK